MPSVDWAECGGKEITDLRRPPLRRPGAGLVALAPALLCCLWLQLMGPGLREGLSLPPAGTVGLAGQEGQPCFCVVRPHGTCCTLHCLVVSVQGERTVVTAWAINTEWGRCDQWAGAGAL